MNAKSNELIEKNFVLTILLGSLSCSTFEFQKWNKDEHTHYLAYLRLAHVEYTIPKK